MDLMLDLVPMLREAGECQDPDAEAAPAPAPLRLASPPVVAAPAVADPLAGGKVIVAPDRFRPPRFIQALAALLPIAAIALWLAYPWVEGSPDQLAQKLAPKVSAELLDKYSWDERTRGLGDSGRTGCDGSRADCLQAGAQLLDLEVAINQGWEVQARDRLKLLKDTLGQLAWMASVSPVDKLLMTSPVDWNAVKAEMKDAFAYLAAEEKGVRSLQEGHCLRAAYLAARLGDHTFFKDPDISARCIGLVGDQFWKADAADRLEDQFHERKFAE
jgi:hypothetical protein